MKRYTITVRRLTVPVVIALLAVALLLAVSTVLAQSGGGYDLTWWTTDGGGGVVSDPSSGYALVGTAGQTEPGVGLSGGDYALVGGFWPGEVSGGTPFPLYLPVILKSALF